MVEAEQSVRFMRTIAVGRCVAVDDCAPAPNPCGSAVMSLVRFRKKLSTFGRGGRFGAGWVLATLGGVRLHRADSGRSRDPTEPQGSNLTGRLFQIATSGSRDRRPMIGPQLCQMGGKTATAGASGDARSHRRRMGVWCSALCGLRSPLEPSSSLPPSPSAAASSRIAQGRQ
jgi:hypothetical protein